MTALRKVLESIETGLEALTLRTKDMQKLLDNLEDALSVERPKAKKARVARKKRAPKKKAARKAKAAKKPARKTATGSVLDMVKKGRSGVTTAQIKKKTGYSERKIWGIVNRLKKEGKIKSEKKGVYTKA